MHTVVLECSTPPVCHTLDPTFRVYWGLSLESRLEREKGDGWVLRSIGNLCKAATSSRQLQFSISMTVDFARCWQSGCFNWQADLWTV